jgi:WXG100 family type VII secretion target
MPGLQQYTPEAMDAHASKTLQHADQIITHFNAVATDVENLKASGGWQDASVDRVIEQINQLRPGINNLHQTLQNHSQVTKKQAANARQLSSDVH